MARDLVARPDKLKIDKISYVVSREIFLGLSHPFPYLQISSVNTNPLTSLFFHSEIFSFEIKFTVRPL